MKRKRYKTYLDKIGQGKLCSQPLSEYVATDVELRETITMPNEHGFGVTGGSRIRPVREVAQRRRREEDEGEETLDVVDFMSGRGR